MLGQINAQPKTQGDPLHISGVLFLCSPLLSGTLSHSLHLLALLRISALFPQLMYLAGFHLGSLPCITAGKLSQGSKLGVHNHRAHLAFLCMVKCLIMQRRHLKNLGFAAMGRSSIYLQLLFVCSMVMEPPPLGFTVFHCLMS